MYRMAHRRGIHFAMLVSLKTRADDSPAVAVVNSVEWAVVVVVDPLTTWNSNFACFDYDWRDLSMMNNYTFCLMLTDELVFLLLFTNKYTNTHRNHYQSVLIIALCTVRDTVTISINCFYTPFTWSNNNNNKRKLRARKKKHLVLKWEWYLFVALLSTFFFSYSFYLRYTDTDL